MEYFEMGPPVHTVVVLIPEDELTLPRSPCWGYTVFVQDLATNATVEDVVEMGASVAPVVEVRMFLKIYKAHVRFLTIPDAIKFMEMGNKHSKLTGLYNGDFRPLMCPSWDYPCVALHGVPEDTTRDHLLQCIKDQYPRVNVIDVRHLVGNYAVVEFESQRAATSMRKQTANRPLRVGNARLTFVKEGPPCARINDINGYKNKNKIRDAFGSGADHIIGIALLEDRGFIYFDYRFNLEAIADELGPKIVVTEANGTRLEFIYALL